MNEVASAVDTRTDTLAGLLEQLRLAGLNSQHYHILKCVAAILEAGRDAAVKGTIEVEVTFDPSLTRNYTAVCLADKALRGMPAQIPNLQKVSSDVEGP